MDALSLESQMNKHSDSFSRSAGEGSETGIEPILSAALDPLFWRPERLGVASGWWAHVPFAFWIVAICRPRLLVELGTYSGVSYAAFCEAAIRSQSGTRCYAVDTWKGDPQTGEYDESIYNEFRSFHDKRYAAFSELIRSAFDEAVRFFEDGTIDILHIDGYHTYESVRNDFEKWRVKLSDHAVVLMHDTNVKQKDFGVWRLWYELRKQYPSFEFSHQHGLGVLAVGRDVPRAVCDLCGLTDNAKVSSIRERFALIGARWLADASERVSSMGMGRDIELANARAEVADAQAATAEREVKRLEERAKASEAKLIKAEQRLHRVIQRNIELRDAVRALATRRPDLEKNTELEQVKRAYESIITSTMWRATALIRVPLAALPSPLRLMFRRVAKLIYWLATPAAMPWRIRILWERYQTKNPSVPVAADATEPKRSQNFETQQRPALQHQCQTFTNKPTATDLAKSTPVADTLSPEGLKNQFRLECARKLSTFLAAGGRIVLPTSEAPEVSIILVLYNGAELTFEHLLSLRHALAVPSEIIIIDNASTDHTHALLSRIDGAHVTYNSDNQHFLRAVNQGAKLSRGRHILLINNDTRIRDGSITTAHTLLDTDQSIGAVGAKIILLDGSLQEAGSIVWNDGTCLGYGRGSHPTNAEFEFRRDVDYVSGAFLMIRRTLFSELGWFDEAFAPAYYEETDLCMRIRKAGYRVVYEPTIEISHFEFGSATSSSQALELQKRNHAIFRKCHACELKQFHYPRSVSKLNARSASGARRILIIDDRVPYPYLGAGYPRAASLLREIAAGSWFITFYPLVISEVNIPEARAAFPAGIEFAPDRGVAGLSNFLADRRGYYDAVLISRPHNMAVFQEASRPVLGFVEATTIIYDAEAVFAEREALRLKLINEPHKRAKYEKALADEMALTEIANKVITVSSREKAVFQSHTRAALRVLGHSVVPKATPTPFDKRRNLLFVGALNGSRQTAPNIDALFWFVQEILPKLDESIGTDYRLMVAGRVEADEVRVLESTRVVLLGVVPDLTELFANSRVFIAPTRFASGLPHKVHEAIAYGVPTVATPLIADQLGCTPGIDIMTGETVETFAAACKALYTDSALWTSIRQQALKKLTIDCSPTQFKAEVDALLADIPQRDDVAKRRASRSPRAFYEGDIT
jgi:O-antigen biosynthesis protein